MSAPFPTKFIFESPETTDPLPSPPAKMFPDIFPALTVIFAEDNFVVVTVPDTSFTTQPPPKTSCEIVPPDMTTFELPSMSEFAPLPLA